MRIKYILFVFAIALIATCGINQIRAQQSETAEAQAPSRVTPPWLQRFSPVRQLYVSTDGKGNGIERSNPTSFKRAIEKADPGDMYLITGGTYRGPFVLKRKGSNDKPIIFRAAPGSRVIIDGGMKITGENTWIWGMEFTATKDNPGTGGPIFLFAPGIHIINNIIHDKSGTGINAWNYGPGQVIYGNIIYRQESKTGNPHNVYTQNDFYKNGYKYFVNNMFLDPQEGAFNFHAYTKSGLVSGYHVEKNIFANGPFLIGGFNKPADREVVLDNNFYNVALHFGYQRPAQARFENNYVARSKLYMEWYWGAGETKYEQTAPNIIVGNEIVQPVNRTFRFRTAANLSSGSCEGCARIRPADVFNNNKYSTPFTASFYAGGKKLETVKLDAWRKATAEAGNAFDTNSSQIENPKGTKVVLIPNEYEPGRAHLAVYNWGKLQNVSVDLSSVVPNGKEFEIYPARATFGQPILLGIYSRPVKIPTGGEEFLVFLVTAK
jgi:hypothetical protein